MSTEPALLARFKDVRQSNNGWSAKCPGHADDNASLSISRGDDGRVLLHCHAGCQIETICKSIGVAIPELFSPSHARSSSPPRRARGRPRRFHTAEEAIASLVVKNGQPVNRWSYHDKAGNTVGWMLRWNKEDNRKEFKPVSLVDGHWEIAGMPKPAVLYRLPEILACESVFVTEGEKAADAAWAIGLPATTSPHGANSAQQADWSPLAGKTVVILPDNDTAGELYCGEVKSQLFRLTPAPAVKVVILPNLPTSGDIVDWIETQGDAAEPDALKATLERLANDAEIEQPDPPATCKPGLFAPFPTNVLPQPIRSFVAETSESIGCDTSFIAVPLLATLAAAIGATRRVAIKADWIEPCILWVGIVGDSGTRKSPAIKAATEPLTRIEQTRLAASTQSEDGSLRHQRLIVSDTTVEALGERLSETPRGLLLERDELAGWLMSFNQYKGGRGADETHWLSLFNATPLRIDRKTGSEKLVYVPRPAVSIVGGIQPETLRRALKQEHFENGLAARLLLAYPPKKPRRWNDDSANNEHKAATHEVFHKLLALDFQIAEGGDLAPVDLPLAPCAKPLWRTFFDAHNYEQQSLCGAEAALWSKLEATALRISLLIHLVRVAADDVSVETPDAVDAVSLAAGITVTRWFASEGRRIYAMLEESNEETDERHLVEWIEKQGGTVTARNLQQNYRPMRGPGKAEAALDKLARDGKGQWEDVPPTNNGGRPTREFSLSTSTNPRPLA